MPRKKKADTILSYGEAALVISFNLDIGYLFQCFYKGLLKEIVTWFPYDDDEDEYFELPCEFRFDTLCTDATSSAIFDCMIKPAILPVDFRHG
jgi:hypothetical protein